MDEVCLVCKFVSETKITHVSASIIASRPCLAKLQRPILLTLFISHIDVSFALFFSASYHIVFYGRVITLSLTAMTTTYFVIQIHIKINTYYTYRQENLYITVTAVDISDNIPIKLDVEKWQGINQEAKIGDVSTPLLLKQDSILSKSFMLKICVFSTFSFWIIYRDREHTDIFLRIFLNLRNLKSGR